jgi:hypothetical protein
MVIPGVDIDQKILVNNQYSEPDSTIAIAIGRVNTHAMRRLRIVPHCKTERLAVIVPATPEDKTCAVDTGKPNILAAPTFSAAHYSNRNDGVFR